LVTEQLALLAVTLYAVVVAGLTLTEALVPKLSDQTYPVALPLAVILVPEPLHTVPTPAVTVTLGGCDTVTVVVAVAEQLPPVAVTVYVVVIAGLTVTACPEPRFADHE
jgi:hypothetical protein